MRNIKKFRFILIALFLFSFSIAGYFFNTLDENEALYEFENWLIPSNVVKNSESCINENKIEYLYYRDRLKGDKNNKFGLYIYAEDLDFINFADKLVNSNGGDWGYVLIPYNVKDYDNEKWRGVFNKLVDKHLIPVIQLHGVDLDDYESQTRKAASFLNSFIWPVRQRYVSVYNEPNDKKFWYGKIDPNEYAEILNYTIDVFKEENDNFFMLNGAFNVSASNSESTMDSFIYKKLMNDHIPGIFNKLDGWASHPYPQPNFTGHPKNTGRWSISAYRDELRFLKNELGLKKELKVFITETGWAHAEGKVYNPSYLPVERVSEYFKIAYEDVWLKDDLVIAVMPFTIWYNPPYDHFSWLNVDKVPYKHYETVRGLKKVKGEPEYLVKKELIVENCE